MALATLFVLAAVGSSALSAVLRAQIVQPISPRISLHAHHVALLVFSESGEPCILVRCVLRLLYNPALLSQHAHHVALRVISMQR
jgi:hypothetical protein